MWFTGGNVLICLKYLYNNTPMFCFGGISLNGHTISSFVSLSAASPHHLHPRTQLIATTDK